MDGKQSTGTSSGNAVTDLIRKSYTPAPNNSSGSGINDASLTPSTNRSLLLIDPAGQGNQTIIANEFDNHKPYLTGQQFEAGPGVIVSLEVRDGEYVVKIMRHSIPSSTGKVEGTKHTTQNAGVLFLREEMLRDMGEQLLTQYLPLLQNIFGKFVPRITSKL